MSISLDFRVNIPSRLIGPWKTTLTTVILPNIISTEANLSANILISELTLIGSTADTTDVKAASATETIPKNLITVEEGRGVEGGLVQSREGGRGREGRRIQFG
jgi:hypothetical protein